jgi:hypothetical protein
MDADGYTNAGDIIEEYQGRPLEARPEGKNR